MDRKRILVVGSCFLVLVLLTGCSTTSGSRSYGSRPSVDESLEVSSVLRFDDVPIPTGFTTIDKESFAFQNDVTRVALLKYVGGKSADEVVAFYGLGHMADIGQVALNEEFTRRDKREFTVFTTNIA